MEGWGCKSQNHRPAKTERPLAEARSQLLRAKSQEPRAAFLVVARRGRKLTDRRLDRFELDGFFQLGRFHIPDKAHRAEDAKTVPVEVNLIPGQTMSRGLRVSVMVVVPAFTKGQHGHPEA